MTTQSVALVDQPAAPIRRKGGAAGRAKRVEAAALVVPALIPILIFSVAPLLSGIGLAFTDATLRRNDTADFIGLKNFVDLLSDGMFWDSFRIGTI